MQTDTTNHLWILHIDGASRTSGAGVWLVLLSPTRKQIKQSVHLDFPVFNNETEYEAMMVGLKLALAVVALKIEIRSDSQLVVRQIQREYEARDEHMAHHLNSVESHLDKLVD